MMMYSQNGGIDVPEIDAVSTCQKFPLEWTRQPWIRPDGRPDVFIPPDWETRFGGAALVELARSTFPDNGAGLGLDSPALATAEITDYLARTVYPTLSS
jgi:hypothetical protein